MKVLIVAGSLQPDGMGRFAHELINHLQTQPESEVVVVAPRQQNDLPLAEGVTVYEIPSLYTIKSVKNIFHYFRVIRKITQTVDLVHFATDYPNYLLGHFFISQPYVITAHGTYSLLGLTKGLKKYLIRRAFREANLIHAVSHYTAERIKEILPDCQLEVINHAVDWQATRPNTVIEKDGANRYIFSAGQLKPRKGIHIALESFAMLAPEFPEVNYLIAGDITMTDYLSLLKKIISIYKLENRVEILGHVSENKRQKLFANCLFYLQPSINEGNVFEGYGIVFLEAGVYHKTVIGTKGSGIEDAIDDGKTGLLVEQNNIVATARAVRSLLADPKLLRRLGEGNYQKSRSQNWELMVNRYIELYKTVLY